MGWPHVKIFKSIKLGLCIIQVFTTPIWSILHFSGGHHGGEVFNLTLTWAQIIIIGWASQAHGRYLA